MSKSKFGSLEELLLLSNYELLATQIRFAEVIHKFELEISWNDAQRKASALIKANVANEYLQDVRDKIGIENKMIGIPVLSEPLLNTPKSAQTISVNPVKEKQPDKTTIFKENYSLLVLFAPELQEELPKLTDNYVLSGNSATNLHGLVNLNSIGKDKYGYYVSLEISEESGSKQKLLLFVSIINQEVHVLSCESSHGTFTVYNNLYTREMVNLDQLKMQNGYLNKQLKKLIKYKLTIPTINIEEVKAPEIKQVPVKKTPDEEFASAYWEWYQKEGNSFPFRTFVPNDQEVQEDEEIESENVWQEYEDLKEEVVILKNHVCRTTYTQAFHILQLLIPGLLDELKHHSFTVTLQSETQDYASYQFQFERILNDICCMIYQRSGEAGNLEYIACFNIREGKEVNFVQNKAGSFGIKEETIIDSPEEVTPESLMCNKVLSGFFLSLLFYKFHAVVTDRVYITQPVESTPVEAHDIEEESDSSGTLIAVSILSAIGLGFLGFKIFK